MPSVTFSVVWPDGETEQYYSPSTIIHEFVKVNSIYSQQEFAERINAALNAASDRVVAKFGYACSAAADEKRKIADKFATLERQNITGSVHVCAMT